ncbi:MAG: hypothetical protein VB068_06770 [Petrimonas sp.]|nr:hypothetical protein [Petrimonas sp.]
MKNQYGIKYERKLHILIIHASPWNDDTSGNNILTNWFSGIDMNFANIYRGSGKPQNECCQKYFQITDMMMLKSLYSNKKAGHSFSLFQEARIEKNISENTMRYFKKNSNGFTSFLRSLVWLFGRYDEQSLSSFIQDFSPDVVFSCRKACLATLRLERIVHQYTEAPFISFTGDDEYSLMQWRFDPFFWIERFMTRRSIQNNVKFYKRYLTLSEEQAENYHKLFGCETGILRKCATFDLYDPEKKCGEPIRMVYAGKLYCNRWHTIGKLSEAISIVNSEYARQVFTLDIYAVDDVKKKFLSEIGKNEACHLHAVIPSSQLPDIYRYSDIILHVESFDRRNKWDTRLSFSTKIIDCLGSGCAVMAISWERQTGFRYLKREDAAICIPSVSEIIGTLRRIAEDLSIVDKYAQKAQICLQRNHNKTDVQEKIINAFTL